MVDSVSITRKPVLVSISSSSSYDGTGKNSSINFSLADAISTNTEQEIGLVSLKSFSFNNCFNNITSNNNILKVVASYNSYGIAASTTTVITVPTGYYTLVQLLYLLNSLIPTTDSNGNLLSFGSSTLATTTSYSYPALSNSNIYSGLVLNQYASLLSQTASSTATNAHEYSSFQLVLDTSTYPLMAQLGFCNKSINPFIQSNQSPLIICSPTYSGTSCTYTLSGTGWTSAGAYNLPYPFNLVYTDTLYIELSNAGSQFRSPYTNLNTSNLIATVPITAGFQTFNYFEPITILPKYVTNLNLATLPITIRDEFGDLVDFRGQAWKCDLWIQFAVNEDQVQNVSARDQTMGYQQGSTQIIPSNLSYQKTNDPLYGKKRFRHN